MDNKNGLLAGFIVIAAIAAGVLLFVANDDDTTEEVSTAEPSSQAAEQTPAAEVEELNIVATAQATPTLSTLVAAVVEADLVDALSADGPLTVFAPDNDAFAALLEDLGVTADELLARDDLADILTYHVVAGDVMAADLTDGQMVETLNGQMLEVAIADGVVTINGAQVTTADVATSNGTVHIIDAVLLPKSE